MKSILELVLETESTLLGISLQCPPQQMTHIL